MKDIELMEAAATAAELEVHRGDGWQSDMLFRYIPRPSSPLVANVEWNPLANDGDALRLAVALRVDVTFLGFATIQARIGDGPIATEYVNIGSDAQAATRRAIVRAAAALSRAPGAE